MYKIHQTAPSIIHRLRGVDTFIINQKFTKEENVLAAEEYTICDGYNGTITVTSSKEGTVHENTPKKIMFFDKEGTLLFTIEYTKNGFFGQVINIYSPAGFLIGCVKESYSYCKRVSEISTGNRELLFCLQYGHQTRYRSTAEIKNITSNEVIAYLTEYKTDVHGSTTFTLIYEKKLLVIQKILILVASLASHTADQFSQHEYEENAEMCVILLLVVIFLPLVIVVLLIIYACWFIYWCFSNHCDFVFRRRHDARVHDRG